MLAKMPQKTVKSPFRNKLTIISLVLLMGLGLSAAYFTVPFLQVPLTSPNNLIGNTTNKTVSSPVSHTNASSIEIQTPQATQTTSTNTSTVSTPSTSKDSNTSKQGTNTSKTTTTNNSKTTTNSKTNTNSQTNPPSTNTKKTTSKTG